MGEHLLNPAVQAGKGQYTEEEILADPHNKNMFFWKPSVDPKLQKSGARITPIEAAKSINITNNTKSLDQQQNEYRKEVIRQIVVHAKIIVSLLERLC